jgi:hypothetical protein
MTEQFLHYIWKYRLFDHRNLITTQGEVVEVKNPGIHNLDAGPDFSHAKVRIQGTLWAGNVELHLFTSQWKLHGHQHNEAYDNVILHVVYEHDADNDDGIPVLELRHHISSDILLNYERMMLIKDGLPCSNHLPVIDDFTAANWLERMLIERIEDKTKIIDESLKQNSNNWEQTFYHLLARNFGFKTNALPFELLAKNTPVEYLAKHKDQLLQIEAMLFGNAGLLPANPTGEYETNLVREYNLLKNKFNSKTTNKSLWKFLRMRPVNFPTVRIAQFAALIHKSAHLLSKIIEVKNLKEIHQLFDVHASQYWDEHYHFSKKADVQKKHLGTDAINNITINTIVPLLFYYGKVKDSERHVKLSLKLLEEIPAERNNITKKFLTLNVQNDKASISQAFIQLHNNYCLPKKCLQCAIGLKIMKQ